MRGHFSAARPHWHSGTTVLKNWRAKGKCPCAAAACHAPASRPLNAYKTPRQAAYAEATSARDAPTAVARAVGAAADGTLKPQVMEAALRPRGTCQVRSPRDAAHSGRCGMRGRGICAGECVRSPRWCVACRGVHAQPVEVKEPCCPSSDSRRPGQLRWNGFDAKLAPVRCFMLKIACFAALGDILLRARVSVVLPYCVSAVCSKLAASRGPFLLEMTNDAL